MTARIRRRERIVAITTREGWFQYYANRYDRTGAEQACHMAVWYLILRYFYEELQPDC